MIRFHKYFLKEILPDFQELFCSKKGCTNYRNLGVNFTVVKPFDDFYYLSKEEYILLKITKIDLLDCNHSLNFKKHAITELPDNLTVHGYLDIQYTMITKLPKNLKLYGRLYHNSENIRVKYASTHERNGAARFDGNITYDEEFVL